MSIKRLVFTLFVTFALMVSFSGSALAFVETFGGFLGDLSPVTIGDLQFTAYSESGFFGNSGPGDQQYIQEPGLEFSLDSIGIDLRVDFLGDGATVGMGFGYAIGQDFPGTQIDVTVFDSLGATLQSGTFFSQEVLGFEPFPGGYISLAFEGTAAYATIDFYDGFAALIDNFFYDELAPAPEFNDVPVPAAAWLLGSGLVGLFGLRRKMKS